MLVPADTGGLTPLRYPGNRTRSRPGRPSGLRFGGPVPSLGAVAYPSAPHPSESSVMNAIHLPPGQQLAAPGKWPLVGEREPAPIDGDWRIRVTGLVAEPRS